MLAVRIVVRGEGIERLHGQEDAGFGIERQFIDALRHDHLTADEGGAEIIVEYADLVSFGESRSVLGHAVAARAAATLSRMTAST